MFSALSYTSSTIAMSAEWYRSHDWHTMDYGVDKTHMFRGVDDRNVAVSLVSPQTFYFLQNVRPQYLHNVKPVTQSRKWPRL